MDNIYRALVGFESVEDDKKHWETKLVILYLAENDVEAVDAAYRFAKDRLKNLVFFKCVLWCMVQRAFLRPIAIDGTFQTRYGDIHHWKCDFPEGYSEGIGINSVPEKAPDKNYYTTEEAAEFLKLQPKTVRIMCREKKIPAKKVGRNYRIAETALKNYMRDL